MINANAIPPKNHAEKRTAETAEDYLRDLSDAKPNERGAALNALLAMGPEGMDALLAHLEKKVYKKPLRAELLQATVIFTFSVIAVYVTCFAIFRFRLTLRSFLFLLVLTLWTQTPIYGMNIISWFRKRNAAAEALTGFDDIRVAGILIKALEFDKKIRLPVRQALLRLLPRMKASDAGLLNADQRHSLYRTLGKNSEEWNVTVLRALEQIGDASAAPFVLPLTQSKNPAIRQAAVDCLPYLQDREARERLSKNLLRASSAEDSPAVLLRPASSPPEPHQAQLLRPASVDTNGE